MKDFGCLSVFVTLILTLFACGTPSKYEEIVRKDFRLYIDSSDLNVQAEFKSLIESFNAHSCLKALQYVPSRDLANSTVVLTKGLQNQDSKVGWGQWKTVTYHSSPFDQPPLTRGKRTVVHTMNLEFDYDYFYKHMNKSQSSENNELFKLFSHEVGHGLQMKHTNDPKDVMYPDISGTKYFELYFRKVKEFFGNDVEKLSC